jgi:hypothetical protein
MIDPEGAMDAPMAIGEVIEERRVMSQRKLGWREAADIVLGTCKNGNRRRQRKVTSRAKWPLARGFARKSYPIPGARTGRSCLPHGFGFGSNTYIVAARSTSRIGNEKRHGHCRYRTKHPKASLPQSHAARPENEEYDRSIITERRAMQEKNPFFQPIQPLEVRSPSSAFRKNI